MAMTFHRSMNLIEAYVNEIDKLDKKFGSTDLKSFSIQNTDHADKLA